MGSIKKSKERSLLIGLILVFCLSFISVRLLFLQTVDSDQLQAEANKTRLLDESLRPKRGTIYDRTKEQILAREVDAYVFVADTRYIKDKEKTAQVLSPLLDIPREVLYNKLNSKKISVELREKAKYKYTKEVSDKINALKNKGELKGIYSYRTTRRQYNNTVASHLLGFINNDDQPVGGVEKSYDRWLRGENGHIKYIKAKNGMMLSDKPETYRAPVNGKNVVLTIDAEIQHAVDKELDNVMSTCDPKGAVAIVADPKTGEILAMSSRPTYNPNDYAATYTSEDSVNRAVGCQFEPGSTFKIATLAAAIEEGVFNSNDTFQSGAIKVDDRTIRDWKKDGWGRITYRQGVQLSSNVAFVKLGQKLGEEKLIKYIDRFGFGNVTAGIGKRTGIDLPNEERGVFFRDSLAPSEFASISFGQGISVTPIQQMAAVCAFANGGILYKPSVVKEIWDSKNEKRLEVHRPEGMRVISQETSKITCELLRSAVEKGTGNGADVPGYRVAGKTGTAQKPDPKGGYMKGKYIVSFIGFAPYDNPEIVVYVAVDEPFSKYGGVSGGRVAGPVAREIFRKALHIRQFRTKKIIAEDIK